MNSEFSFSLSSCLTKAEELSLPYYLPIAGGRIIGFIPFPRVLVLCEIAISLVQDLNSHRRIHFQGRNYHKSNCNSIAVMSILLCGCTTWTLIMIIKKKLDRDCTRILRAILNKSWKQHPSKPRLYGHLPPITKIIQIRWIRLLKK